MYSVQRVVSDGSLQVVDLSFYYFDRSEIAVYINSELYTDWQWASDVEDRIIFNEPIPAGIEVLIKRTTDLSKLRHYFSKGSAFTAEALDEDLQQVLHIAQEATEASLSGDFFTDIDMHGYRVRNIGPAVDDSDALTLRQYKQDAQGAWVARNQAEQFKNEAASYASSAQTYANNSAASAQDSLASVGSAQAYATSAAASASAAAQSATNAAASATAAAQSATNAAASATAAAQSATNAAASFDAFDDRYLGAKPSDPVTDNDGNALVTGALYWNTAANKMRVWNGSSWRDIGVGADASLIDYLPAGTGAVVRTVQDKMRERVSVLDFIPPGVNTRTTDCAPYIQAALDAVPNGGAVYFPKTGAGYAGPSYYIASGLTLSKNDVTLYSDARAEYSEGLITDQAITMLTITAFGARLDGLTFWGNGTPEVFGSTNGVVIDRRSLGDAETYSNLDCDIQGCGFIYLNDCVRAVGRNVFVLGNIFSNSKRGVVGELHTYNAGATVSQFRGWRISRNRFHSIGNPYISAASVEPQPASTAAWDSWCIQMPQTSANTSHIEVLDNNADMCGGGFYKGTLGGVKISGNISWRSVALFVYADITDVANQEVCDTHLQEITNNLTNNRQVSNPSVRGYLADYYSIYLRNVRNLKIAGNSFINAVYDHIYASGCDRLKLESNELINANNRYAYDSTVRPAVTIVSAAGVHLSGNHIRSQLGGTVYSSAFATSGLSDVKVRGNTLENAINRYGGLSAEQLANGDDDALPWQTPVAQNGYVITGRGYRRLFDGTVEIDVQLTGGADNAVAFTLPPGYRPAAAITLPSIAVWASTDAYAYISNMTGEVRIHWNSTAASSYHIRHRFAAA